MSGGTFKLELDAGADLDLVKAHEAILFMNEPIAYDDFDERGGELLRCVEYGKDLAVTGS